MNLKNPTTPKLINEGKGTRILVVDDEPDMVTTLRDLLVNDGHYVDVAHDGMEALSILGSREYEILLTDLSIPELDGVDLLRRSKERHPELQVIIITGYGTIDSAVEAMKSGAFNYLIKPVEPQEILANVERIKQILFLKERSEESCVFHNMVGRSRAMQRVFDLIPKLARLQMPVLIEGETGTGKELVGRALHDYSRHKNQPFVPLDCGSLPESLLESELFGHKQGAFTGSTCDRRGLLEMANGGSLLLDEISNASLHLQTRLLRVIEEKQIRRVGDENFIDVDFRVLSASNASLASLVEAGTFREDLYYRLCGFVLELPPLRERREDIPVLAEHFLTFFKPSDSRKPEGFSSGALDALVNYDWPGNVRELRLVVERGAALCHKKLIEVQDLVFTGIRLPHLSSTPKEGPRSLLDQPFYAVVEEVERKYLTELLGQVSGNISQASKLSGASRKTIREKAKRYGIL